MSCKKIFVKYIGGAIIGFIGAYFALYVIDHFGIKDLLQYNWLFLISSVLVTLGAIVYNTLLIINIKKLDRLSVNGMEEDQVNQQIYRKFSDTILVNNLAQIFAMLTLASTAIFDLGYPFLLDSFILLVVSFILTAESTKVGKLVYPDCPLPDLGDLKYTDRLLEVADDGEKHVIFQGMYKSFNLTQITLLLGLFASIIYSLVTGLSQMFSIVAIAVIFIIMNSRYLLAIRNKG